MVLTEQRRHLLDLFLDHGRQCPAAGRRRGGLGDRRERLGNFVQSVALGGDDRNDRDAQRLRQNGGIDPDTMLERGIAHCQRNNDRNAKVEKLRRQVKISLQVGGIHDIDNGIGARRIVTVAQENIAGDSLIWGVRGQRVEAGQVDQADDNPAIGRDTAFFALDRNSGIVADLLAQTS